MKTIIIDGVEYNLTPKYRFTKGDWVVSSDGKIWHITGLDGKYYQVISTDGEHSYFTIENQDDMQFWTIQDAKDGDVLRLGLCTVIYKEIVGGNAWCYCSYTDEEGFDAIDDNDHLYGLSNAFLATKEQCDLLFAKMKEAGYEWDAEKKELKKTESTD